MPKRGWPHWNDRQLLIYQVVLLIAFGMFVLWLTHEMPT